MPYFPYARQERMSHGREAISARVVANLIEVISVAALLADIINNIHLGISISSKIVLA